MALRVGFGFGFVLGLGLGFGFGLGLGLGFGLGLASGSMSPHSSPSRSERDETQLSSPLRALWPSPPPSAQRPLPTTLGGGEGRASSGVAAAALAFASGSPTTPQPGVLTRDGSRASRRGPEPNPGQPVSPPPSPPVGGGDNVPTSGEPEGAVAAAGPEAEGDSSRINTPAEQEPAAAEQEAAVTRGATETKRSRRSALDPDTER